MILESENNKILQEDIEQITEQISLEELKGSTVLVTGATGLIGSQVVKTLACFNRLKEMDIELVSMKEAGIDVDIEEYGRTFSENALIKAQVLYTDGTEQTDYYKIKMHPPPP